MNFEEILDFLEQSDEDVDDQVDTKEKESDKNAAPTKPVDYSDIYNELLRESSSYESDSADANDYYSADKSLTPLTSTNNPEECSNLFNDENFANGFGSDIPLDQPQASVNPNALDTKATTKFENDFEGSDVTPESQSQTSQRALEEGKICKCEVDTDQLIKDSTRNCGELFVFVKHCVDMQLAEWENKHKLHVIHKLRSFRNRLSSRGEEEKGSDDPESEETLIPDISKNYLKTLGLPSNTLVEDLQTSKMTIRCRHKLSTTLELLKIFDDRFYSIEESSMTRITKTSSNLLTPTCICTSSDLLLFGTMCGSVFISEFSTYNSERKFCSYNEYEAVDPTIDPLNWYEIDSEKGLSVTSLDILPLTGWITVGYSDGTVKLIQNFKITRTAKGHPNSKNEQGESKNADTRTFGMMADAVSSAFSGIKKTSSQTLCSTDVFNDSVLNCKFTSESYEEIICSNLRSIAILTYSKNVLSHNLNVNYLQSLNERLENDQIVDIVCLSSNPQAKFITGGDSGGVCAILTFKTCLIFSTRPRLSILINVTLDKLNKNILPDLSQVPSITWMIFNTGKKNIKPLLLISLGNQIRFIQCNLQTEKGSLSMNVSNMGTIQFKQPIRSIRIVTRLILAVVDYSNCLHIIQINLTSSPMYYDIIRTLDLNEFSNKMELGIEVFDPLWLIQTSLLSTITVYSKTVKMVAKGYKKFSNLVSDLFQGKKHTSSFELKNFTILILVPNGVVGIEINSWVKVIGELSASKLFPEALAIIHALSEEWIPGLYDFRAFKNNLNQLVLYILHQSSAHIIKLSKFVNETQNISTNLLNLESEAPKDDFWNTKVKTDVYEQINTLCCSMIDICVSARLYEPLNDLIFRCFATINLENVFSKYILLNYHHGRISLQFLNSQIIESIFNTYEMVLDNMYAQFLKDRNYAEEEILYINEIITSEKANGKQNHKSRGNSDNTNLSKEEKDSLCTKIVNLDENMSGRGKRDFLFEQFQFDSRLLVYHIICSNLCKIQLYCYKNNVITETNKAISRLSRHVSWHCLIYCHSVVLDDYSNLLNMMLLHADNKFKEIQSELAKNGKRKHVNEKGEESEDKKVEDEEPSEREDEDDERGLNKEMGNEGGMLPLSISENLFVVRVIFLTLESFITFENCGLTDTVDTANYCNFISYIASTESFKPTFPLECKNLFAREDLLYDYVSLDYQQIESQKFPYDFVNAESTVIFKLLKISPRLFFVCLYNLFNNCSEKFGVHSKAVGTKLSTFNFLMNVVTASIHRMEEMFGSDQVRMVKKTASFLFLNVSSTSESINLNFNTAFLAIYTLLTSKDEDCELNPNFKAEGEYTKELIQPEGYFNNNYFYEVFYRKDRTFRNNFLMVVNKECAEETVFRYLKNLLKSISQKLDSASDLTHNSHFSQLSRMCREFIPLTTKKLRFFFYQITGDFNNIIGEYESFEEEESIFEYLDRCIEYINFQTRNDPENIQSLLMMDSTIRKNFVRAIMMNLPMLIKTDLNKVTHLLIQLFSLMDIIKTLDSTLETSPETILNTLEKLPDLQLLVLDALLKSKSTSGNMLQLPNSYFNRYLNLLSLHDKTNVTNFLKRQKTLNITYCLKICKQNNIEDAVIYLLIRAGNLEEAIESLLVSFSNNINSDLKACSDLIETACGICQDYHNQISYEIIEKMWFKMMKLTIDSLCQQKGETERDNIGNCSEENNKEKGTEELPSNTNRVNDQDEHNQENNVEEFDGNVESVSGLVKQMFTSGILKYVKFPRALMEIIKYDASLKMFKIPLHNLLSDFQLQTYIANSASTISKIIMNKEFRSRQVFNSRGVVINTISPNAKINRNLVCFVCNRNLLYSLNLDSDPPVQSERPGRRPKAHQPEESKISTLEEQIGLISQVPIQGDKNTSGPPETASIINNIYNDRLSSFIDKKNRTIKSLNQTHNLALYPPVIQTIVRDLDAVPKDPIIVYWCRHSFHQKCAPLSCPICNIDEY